MGKPPLRRIHCSYHKCLTIYFSRVMEKLYNELLPRGGGYKHFNSMIDDFYEAVPRHRVLSVNNHALDLDRLGDFRITRFVRDPRDLIVSGYFYHQRGAEEWCTVKNPGPEDWQVVNGTIPAGIGPGQSYAEYLQAVPEEEGLMAEIEFRRAHFDSMARWPVEHPRILTIRYEDVLGNEAMTFARIFRFYELGFPDRMLGNLLARRYSARRQRRQIAHIRNPEPQQWRKRFTPAVKRFFDERHGGLIAQYGYDA